MAGKQKRVEAAKQRDKRSKIALAALGVVFLAVAAFEIPSMLKVMNKKPPPPATHVAVSSGPTEGLPNLGTGGAAPAKPSGQLVDTDVPPASGAGQLVSFEAFQPKNPFVPQVTTPSATTSTPTTALPNQPPTSTTSTVPTPPSSIPSNGGSGAPTTTTPPAPPLAPTVTIAVNGVTNRVGVAGTFPTGAPVFRLVSFQAGTARIGIVGGSYSAGGATLALHVGQPVTLQNTADGKQYKLELLKTP